MTKLSKAQQAVIDAMAAGNGVVETLHRWRDATFLDEVMDLERRGLVRETIWWGEYELTDAGRALATTPHGPDRS